jgi:hypothetical protein
MIEHVEDSLKLLWFVISNILYKFLIIDNISESD